MITETHSVTYTCDYCEDRWADTPPAGWVKTAATFQRNGGAVVTVQAHGCCADHAALALKDAIYDKLADQ